MSVELINFKFKTVFCLCFQKCQDTITSGVVEGNSSPGGSSGSVVNTAGGSASSPHNPSLDGAYDGSAEPSVTMNTDVPMETQSAPNDPALARVNQDKALATMGLYRFRIPGDGNCLFRAIASQLKLDQERYHPVLRKAAVKWMKANVEDLIANNMLDTVDEILEAAEDEAWAGQAAIVALANIFSINIAVIQGGDKGDIDIQHISPFESEVDSEEQGSAILAYMYNGHFDAVVDTPNLPNPEYEAWQDRRVRKCAVDQGASGGVNQNAGALDEDGVNKKLSGQDIFIPFVEVPSKEDVSLKYVDHPTSPLVQNRTGPALLSAHSPTNQIGASFSPANSIEAQAEAMSMPSGASSFDNDTCASFDRTFDTDASSLLDDEQFNLQCDRTWREIRLDNLARPTCEVPKEKLVDQSFASDAWSAFAQTVENTPEITPEPPTVGSEPHVASIPGEHLIGCTLEDLDSSSISDAHTVPANDFTYIPMRGHMVQRTLSDIHEVSEDVEGEQSLTPIAEVSGPWSQASSVDQPDPWSNFTQNVVDSESASSSAANTLTGGLNMQELANSDTLKGGLNMQELANSDSLKGGLNMQELVNTDTFTDGLNIQHQASTVSTQDINQNTLNINNQLGSGDANNNNRIQTAQAGVESHSVNQTRSGPLDENRALIGQDMRGENRHLIGGDLNNENQHLIGGGVSYGGNERRNVIGGNSDGYSAFHPPNMIGYNPDMFDPQQSVDSDISLCDTSSMSIALATDYETESDDPRPTLNYSQDSAFSPWSSFSQSTDVQHTPNVEANWPPPPQPHEVLLDYGRQPPAPTGAMPSQQGRPILGIGSQRQPQHPIGLAPFDIDGQGLDANRPIQYGEPGSGLVYTPDTMSQSLCTPEAETYLPMRQDKDLGLQPMGNQGQIVDRGTLSETSHAISHSPSEVDLNASNLLRSRDPLPLPSDLQSILQSLPARQAPDIHLVPGSAPMPGFLENIPDKSVSNVAPKPEKFKTVRDLPKQWADMKQHMTQDLDLGGQFEESPRTDNFNEDNRQSLDEISHSDKSAKYYHHDIFIGPTVSKEGRSHDIIIGPSVTAEGSTHSIDAGPGLGQVNIQVIPSKHHPVQPSGEAMRGAASAGARGVRVPSGISVMNTTQSQHKQLPEVNIRVNLTSDNPPLTTLHALSDKKTKSQTSLSSVDSMPDSISSIDISDKFRDDRDVKYVSSIPKVRIIPVQFHGKKGATLKRLHSSDLEHRSDLERPELATGISITGESEGVQLPILTNKQRVKAEIIEERGEVDLNGHKTETVERKGTYTTLPDTEGPAEPRIELIQHKPPMLTPLTGSKLTITDNPNVRGGGVTPQEEKRARPVRVIHETSPHSSPRGSISSSKSSSQESQEGGTPKIRHVPVILTNEIAAPRSRSNSAGKRSRSNSGSTPSEPILVRGRGVIEENTGQNIPITIRKSPPETAPRQRPPREVFVGESSQGYGGVAYSGGYTRKDSGYSTKSPPTDTPRGYRSEGRGQRSQGDIDHVYDSYTRSRIGEAGSGEGMTTSMRDTHTYQSNIRIPVTHIRSDPFRERLRRSSLDRPSRLFDMDNDPLTVRNLLKPLNLNFESIFNRELESFFNHDFFSDF